MGMSTLDSCLGGKLKEIREAKGLSLEDVAQRVDISVKELQDYEENSEDISAALLYQLSRIYKTLPSSFFE